MQASMESNFFDFMINKELIQVCVGLFQVILKFTDELNVSIENTYYIDYGSGSVEASGDNINDSKNLLVLLGKSIFSAENVEEDQHILITFSDNYSLKLIPDKLGGESYSITYKEKEIFV
ncbi:hypothetical protein [Nostoc sp. FACHB-190]|uniref:hypothetical protein n=1 Tax=Nostoc sp. FACHB-190 TaxID=2692838 RepID=UPI0016820905|nr:hypothetical protein [Nostoc sp. FACHB-190]MBD2303100.1 hypothetical protein [Nostoc sp. FACHB-190]